MFHRCRGVSVLAVASLLLAMSSATLAAPQGYNGGYVTSVSSNSPIAGALHVTGKWNLWLPATWYTRSASVATVDHKRSGSWRLKHNGAFADAGKFQVAGSTITFTDTTPVGKSHLIGCPGHGKYRFKLSGKKLKFTLISDPAKRCHNRIIVLTSHSFTKV